MELGSNVNMLENCNVPEPYPILPTRGHSPFELRCSEIDDAAVLIRNPESFALAAKGDRVLSEGDPHPTYLEKPDGPYLRHFTEEGGCPAFRGILNAGSTANVVCGLADVQLHSYCSLKFCEKGRKVYCPIWKARGSQMAVPESND